MGNAHPALILLVPPLFDESNRMRRTLVLTMRALASLGHDSALPDLPGQNDSLLPTEAASLSQWQAALSQFCDGEQRPVVTASWRGGALIDAGASVAARWRMAPVSGSSLLRTLARAKIAGEREAGRTLSLDALLARMRAETVELAGNRLSPDMVRELEAATVHGAEPLRTVSVGHGPEAIAGTPLWLRAEPGEDARMAEAMASDIAAWARACVSN